MRLSIITVNYNNVNGLKKTIDSVIDQDYNDYEYVIIDGGSEDGSVDLIKANDQHLSYWVSEPDTGIYNAMNKGIQKAKGDYLLMMNAGDYLINSNVLTAVLSQTIYEDIIYGNVLWNDKGVTFEETYPAKLSFQFFRTNSLGHQSALIRKRLHDTIGRYDENLTIISDWKFLLTAIAKYNVSYKHIPMIISVCDRDGISCKPESLNKIKLEKDSVLKSDFSAFVGDYLQMDSLQTELKTLNNDIWLRVKRKISKLLKNK